MTNTLDNAFNFFACVTGAAVAARLFQRLAVTSALQGNSAYASTIRIATAILVERGFSSVEAEPYSARKYAAAVQYWYHRALVNRELKFS